MKRFILFLLMTISCSLMSYSQDVVGYSTVRSVNKGEVPQLWFMKNKKGIFLCIGGGSMICEESPYKILLKHSDGKVDVCENPIIDSKYQKNKISPKGYSVKKRSYFNVTKIKMSNIVKIRCVFEGEKYIDTSVIYSAEGLYELMKKIAPEQYPIGEELSRLQSEAIAKYKDKMAVSSGADF